MGHIASATRYNHAVILNLSVLTVIVKITCPARPSDPAFDPGLSAPQSTVHTREGWVGEAARRTPAPQRPPADSAWVHRARSHVLPRPGLSASPLGHV